MSAYQFVNGTWINEFGFEFWLDVDCNGKVDLLHSDCHGDAVVNSFGNMLLASLWFDRANINNAYTGKELVVLFTSCHELP